MSYVTSLYHIVFSTYRREPTITAEHRHHLYKVIASNILELKSKALIIDGTQDHIHILLSLNPNVALSDLMRKIKSNSSKWAKNSNLFPIFKGWESEYGAFSLSSSHKEAVYQYIKNQQNHHNTTSLDHEFKRLVMKAGLQFYEAE